MYRSAVGKKSIKNAFKKVCEKFGGIDICINNASAIHLTDTVNTPMKRYDLMHGINVRGTFMLSQKTIPHLKNGDNPHILTLSPPLDIDRKWFGMTLAYTTAKYGMSLVAHGLAEELGKFGVASNCLWPRTSLDTAAVRNVIGAELVKGSRKPSGFAKPTKISNELCEFMGKEVGTELARTEVTQYVIQYITDRKLQNPNNRKAIIPDDPLKELLGVTEDDEVTYDY